MRKICKRKRVWRTLEVLVNSKEANSSQDVDYSGKVQDGENVAKKVVGDGQINGEEAAT